MIEQFDDPGFVTPTPGSPDKPNRVYSLLNEDIAYALYQQGVVGSTNVAQSKIVSWVRQANENPGLVKYADLEIRSQKHNGGTSYFIRFTVLDVIPPTVVKAPKRPDSDKSRKRNKVIKDEVDVMMMVRWWRGDDEYCTGIVDQGCKEDEEGSKGSELE